MQVFHLVLNMNFGGLQEIVRILCLAQRRAGHTVTVGCWENASNNPDVEKELHAAGVDLIYLRRGPHGQQIFGKKYSFLRLKNLLGKGKVDILHVHNPFNHYVYGALAARAAGHTKILQTVHATVWLEGRRKWKWTFRTGAMLSHSIVSVCSEVESVLRGHFALPRRKLAVIENGIDLNRFLAVPAHIAGKEVVLGTIGRMSREKNHKVLIEAFAAVQTVHDNLRLRLLGTGPREQEIKALTKQLGIEHRVEFCGVSRDTPAFFAALDIFVLPSDSEAMPLTLLEALASAVPAVATSVGNVPRILEKTGGGWLCAPGDKVSLAQALESAIGCENRIQMGVSARSKITQHYSAERMAADYERHYRKLLGERVVSQPVEVATS